VGCLRARVPQAAARILFEEKIRGRERERNALTGIVAAGGVFDLDHVRSQVGEEHRRRWACEHAREVDHPEALKRGRHPVAEGR
jgi:hypothetical protein